MLKYIVIAIGAFALGAGVVYDAYNAKYKNLQKEYSLLNDRAKFEYGRIKKDYESIKEKTDEEYKTNITELNSELSSMYSSREETIRHYKQHLASSTRINNELRDKYNKLLDEVQHLDAELSAIIEKCDGDRIRLNNIKEWAGKQAK